MNFRFIVGLVFLLFCIHALAQPGMQWQKSLGGTGYDYGNDGIQADDGGYVVIGSSSSNNGDVTINKGSSDYWIIKLDSLGVIQWQKSLGGSSDDDPYSIDKTQDGGYVIAGGSSSTDGDVVGNYGSFDYWVIKINNSGVIQWKKCFGGTGIDIARSVKSTKDGGYVVAGSTNSNDGDVTGFHPSSGGGLNDYWVIKIDSIGNLKWEKTFGGSYDEIAYSINQTKDNGYIIGGTAESNNGDVIGKHNGVNWADCWLVKTDSIGNLQWRKALGGSNNDVLSRVMQTKDGGYLVGGYTSSSDGDVVGCSGGGANCWIIKISSIGIIQWQKCMGIGGVTSIDTTSDGNYIISSQTSYPSGYLIVKLDTIGSIKWQGLYGGSNNDFPSSIRQTRDGGFIIIGFSNSNDWDVTGHHGLTGFSDYWIVKLLCVQPNPLANFNISTLSICNNGGVSCTNMSVNSVSWIWKINGTLIDSLKNFNYIFNSPGTYMVSLIVHSGSCDSYKAITDTLTKTVVVHPLPNVSITGLSTFYCVNSPNIYLSGSPIGGTFYGNGVSGNNFNPMIAGAGIQTITYSATDLNGCKNSDTQSVNIKPTPNLSFTGLLNNYCSGSVMSNLTGLPPGGLFTGSGILGNDFDPKVATIGIDTIKYTFTDTNSCSNTVSQIVKVKPNPIVSFSGLNSKCCINTPPANLMGIPAGGTFSGKGISGNTFNSVIAGLGRVLINYFYTDTNGCSSSSVDSSFVYGLPVVNFSGFSDNYCYGASPVSLTGTPPGGLFSGSGITGNLFTPSSAGSGIHRIMYSYSDTNTCPNSVSYTITVDTFPKPLITGTTTICQGQSTTLIASGGQTFLWSNNDTTASIVVNPLSTGTYTVTVSNNCGTAILSIPVIVNYSPLTNVSSDTTIIIGGSAELSASGGNSYFWQPSVGLNCISCSPVIASPGSTTTYYVQITNSNGCSSIDTVIVFVDQNDLVFVPEAFSPNGDGKNDKMLIYGKSIKSVQLIVYNRWGEKIFESNDQNIGWDGYYKGQLLPPDVFVYYVRAILFSDKQVIKKGDISLIR
jgi:gliding motility-associated-like protein